MKLFMALLTDQLLPRIISGLDLPGTSFGLKTIGSLELCLLWLYLRGIWRAICCTSSLSLKKIWKGLMFNIMILSF